jgi:hypothetical protein
LPTPPPPIEINREEEFEVSKIIDSHINWRRLEYLVHWQGYELSERTWEPTTNLANAPKMINKFHRQYPTKPSAKDIWIQHVWINTTPCKYHMNFL